MKNYSVAGTPVERKEDIPLLKGKGVFVDDITLSRMAHLFILRSPHAHANVIKVDVSKALNHPSVITALTSKDTSHLGMVPGIALPGVHVPEHPILAEGKVRHVGDPIAAIVVNDKYQAKDALELIDVQYEVLEAVVDPEQASAANSPVLHENIGSNLAGSTGQNTGDIEKGFKQASHVISARLDNQRLAPSSMETRGVVAEYKAGSLTVWSSTQAPHGLQSALAKILQLSQSQVRAIAPDVGGAFGAKSGLSAEEILTSYLSIKLGIPIKWIEDRTEAFLAAPHGRSLIEYVEAGFTDDGKIVALKTHILLEMGAYMYAGAARMAPVALSHIVGCYNIPNVSATLDYILTNKSPVSFYRGAGRPEGIFLVERIMDIAAQELKIDPADIRKRNFITNNSFPHDTGMGLIYDSGNYENALDKALSIIKYPNLRKEQDELRKQGRLMGIGICSYVESSGLGPPVPGFGGWESARLKVDPAGKVTVYTGTSPHGQGHETVFAQIVAGELGVNFSDINVIHGDTATTPQGTGTFGSRSLVVGGSAVYMAAEKLRTKAIKMVAAGTGVSEDHVAFENGKYVISEPKSQSLSFPEVAYLAHDSFRLPIDVEPGLEVSAFFQPRELTCPFGVQIAIVDVDPSTGNVSLKRLLAIEDCGKVINPMLADGQLQGGIAQGIGQALCESMIYDSTGQATTGSFMDYAMPTAENIPAVEIHHTETPSTLNPLGAKGVGESGSVGSTPAVANAVIDALKTYGVNNLDMPLTGQKIWEAINKSKSSNKST